MWRGGKAKSRPVPVLPGTERLKMGALVPCSFTTIYLQYMSPERRNSLDDSIEMVTKDYGVSNRDSRFV